MQTLRDEVLMSVENTIGLIVACALVGSLTFALIFSERF
ncbi:potassium-transporting ATPase subunit F [Actinacidiphila soli]|nr:potassium-transporting ATPase subunit F [Actinacidiphila soli]